MSPLPSPRRSLPQRSGITALESLLSVVLVTIAGAALLSALGSAVRSSREISLTTIAEGLAEQLMCEVAASPVPVGATPTQPSAPRVNFRVVDHFHGWDESPPRDRLGRLIGTEGNSTGMARPAGWQADSMLLAKFRRTVSVEKVALSGGTWITTSSDSLLRRITVRVEVEEEGRRRTLSELSRIVGHVSPAI